MRKHVTGEVSGVKLEIYTWTLVFELERDKNLGRPARGQPFRDNLGHIAEKLKKNLEKTWENSRKACKITRITCYEFKVTRNLTP